MNTTHSGTVDRGHPDSIRRRKIWTLRAFYQGVLIEGARWVACVACGALYPDPSDLADCHRCPVQA